MARWKSTRVSRPTMHGANWTYIGLADLRQRGTRACGGRGLRLPADRRARSTSSNLGGIRFVGRRRCWSPCCGARPSEGKPLAVRPCASRARRAGGGVWRRVDPRRVILFSPVVRNPRGASAPARRAGPGACPLRSTSILPNVSLAVEIDNVTRRFGNVQALAGVSLDVEEGEFFGPAGSERRGQDDADLGPRGTHPGRHAARRACWVTTSPRTTATRAARWASCRRSSCSIRSSRCARRSRSSPAISASRNNGAWIDEILHHLDLTSKARREHALAVRRHEAPRARRARRWCTSRR